MEAISKELELLDRALCQLLLEGLEGVLRDQLALRALEEAVSRGGCPGHTGPAQPARLTCPSHAHSWSRARALGQWSPWTVQQVLSWSAWCWNPECWCRNLSSPLSTCWGH